MKKYAFTIMALLSGIATVCGQTAAASVNNSSGNATEFQQIMTLVLIVSVFAVIGVALMAIIRANLILQLDAQQQIALNGGTAAPADDIWTLLRKKYWENPVPIEKEADITFNHNYDGIQELDNHLPPWWVNMFIVTVIWAGGYMWYYHFGGGGPDQIELYKQDVEKAKQQMAVALAGKGEVVDEASVTALTDVNAVSEGTLVYINNCAACHGQSGEGGVGPNLTDDNWLHGGGIKNVFKAIKYGIPEKGMRAWASQLKPSDIQKVASYILTLKGTNPANAKAPQGDLWKEPASSVSAAN
jgi:cytochrome c oxidase cbb3-type subunit III